MKLLLLFLFVILLFFQSCNLTEADIKEQSWKFSEGLNIGDWINFNNATFSLLNDTIYLNGKPVAKIVSSKISSFGSKRFINIESLQNKETGVYIEK